MSSNPSPAPILVAVRIRNNTPDTPNWVAEGHKIVGRAHCSLCNVEYLIAAKNSNGDIPDPQQKARQIVLLTHPRHPEIIDLENPWG
jgi:hypothetical protein